MADTDLRTDRPHSARVYDYLLGGKDNYAADRAAADDLITVLPGLRVACRANRAFMHRSARYMAGQGVRQFLDIGTGIPTEPNLHQVLQELDPEVRVVYVDHDPIVLAHAAALMADSTGRTTYLDADARSPEAILGSEQFRETIDRARPTGLSMIALLHFVVDDDEAASIVRRLVDALPSGSHLAITQATSEFDPEGSAKALARYNAAGVPFRLRTREQILAFFDGLEMVEPGLVQVHKWRPDEPLKVATIADRDVSWYGGVARKP